MNPDVKEKWVTALESGEFEQTIGALCKPATEGDTRQYCCLGVLSELYRRETGRGKWELSHDQSCYRFVGEGGKGIFIGRDSSAGFLIDDVRRWAGIPDSNPDSSEAGNGTLSEMNDKGASFERIAEVIEKNL